MKLRNLWEYTAARSSLLSKRIYLRVSAHEENTENEARGKANFEINTSSLFCTVAIPIEDPAMTHRFNLDELCLLRHSVWQQTHQQLPKSFPEASFSFQLQAAGD